MSNANVETIHQTPELPQSQPQLSSKKKIQSKIHQKSIPLKIHPSSETQQFEQFPMSSETDEETLPESSEPTSLKPKPSKSSEPTPIKPNSSKSHHKTHSTPEQSTTKSKDDNIDVLTLPNEFDDTIPSLPFHPEQTTHNNKRDDNEVFKQLKTEKNTTQIPQISVKVKFPRLKNLDESTKLFFTN